MKAYNYLCDAAIILTASRLGLSVGCEDWAISTLTTKKLPEVISHGFLSRIAKNAIEIVNLKGKGEDADKMAFEILKEYNCLSEKIN